MGIQTQTINANSRIKTSGKVWVTKADFDTGVFANVVSYRNNDLQLSYTWAAGGNLSTARRLNGCAGTQSAGLCFGGGNSAGDRITSTEEYNGTAWAGGGNLISAVYQHGGSGTQTTAIKVGGARLGGQAYTPRTEEYNGSAWSSGGDLNLGKRNNRTAGNSGACIHFCGYRYVGSDRYYDTSELYNGSAWSVDADLSEEKQQPSGAGSSTSALCIGGWYPSASKDTTEEYNGTSWSTVGSLNAANYGHVGGGTPSSAWMGTGYTGGYGVVTEEYDGTTWHTQPSCTNGRRNAGGAGVVGSGFMTGGENGAVMNETEEQTFISSGTWAIEIDSGSDEDPSLDRKNTSWENLTWESSGGSLKARVKSASTQSGLGGIWSSGGDLNNDVWGQASCGVQNSALSYGGTDGSNTNRTEEYNGTAWSAGGATNLARRVYGGCGTQTAGLGFGGYTTVYVTNTEEYDGTSWCSATDLPKTIGQLGSAGTQTAGLGFGGWDSSTEITDTTEYDGTTWSTGGDLSTARRLLAGAGTQTAALSIGGYLPATYVGNTEEYNGSSWTTASNLVVARGNLGGAGTQSAGLAFSGYDGSVNQVVSEEYDGTNWFIIGHGLSIARRGLGGVGTQAGLAFGGYLGSVGTVSTEEYTVGTATWYPTGTYYTTQPQEVGCPDNRWYRLELTLVSASTPEVEQIGQDYHAPANQEIWQTKNDFKEGTPDGTSFTRVSGEIQLIGAWSTAANLNAVRSVHGSLGTATAALAFAGLDRNLGTNKDTTEEYGGTSWSVQGNLSETKRVVRGVGTVTAGLAIGGFIAAATDTCEEFGGTSWSVVASLNSARYGVAKAGTQSSALATCGYSNILGANLSTSELYDGTSWSTEANVNVARRNLAGFGDTPNVATCFGGYTDTQVATSEDYNGTSWSLSGDLSEVKAALEGCGTQSGGFSVAGATAIYYKTVEEYCSPTWSVGADLLAVTRWCGASGNTDTALQSGGDFDSSNSSDTCEEYSGWVSGASGSWLSEARDSGKTDFSGSGYEWRRLLWENTGGGDVKARVRTCDNASMWDFKGWTTEAECNLAVDYIHGSGFGGSSSSAMKTGGDKGANYETDVTEEYDGLCWSSGGSLLDIRNRHGGAGSVTAGLIWCGSKDRNAGTKNTTEEYNGVCWSAGNNMLIACRPGTGFGSQTAALSISDNTNDKDVYHYDGTTWSNYVDLNIGRSACGGNGTTTDALVEGSGYAPSEYTTEAFDGSAWSTGGDLNYGRDDCTGAGTGSSDALVSGGASSTGSVAWRNERYDGTSWSNTNNMSEQKTRHAGAGTGGSALMWCGYWSGIKATTTLYSEDAPTWYPTTGSGYYEASGYDIQAPAKRYFQVEMVLTEGSSPQIPEITQEFGLSSSFHTDAITANGSIVAVVLQTINASASIQPILTGDARISPIITANADIVSVGLENITGNGRVQPVLTANGQVFPGITGNANVKVFDKVWASKADFDTGTYDNVEVLQDADGDSLVMSVTGKAWSIGGDLNHARYMLQATGSQTAGLSIGGYDGAKRNYVEEYNGSAWANATGYPLSEERMGACGTQTASICCGGLQFTGGDRRKNTYHYNGTAWSAGGDLNRGKYAHGASGTETAALEHHGYQYNPNQGSVVTEAYDGTSWSSEADSNQGLYVGAFGGTADDAIWAGGNPTTSYCEEYNGTAWSAGGSLNLAKKNNAGSGASSSSALSHAGQLAGDSGQKSNEEYNGTSWTVGGSLSVARREHAGTGNTSAALCIGGRFGGSEWLDSTEEYSASTGTWIVDYDTGFDNADWKRVGWINLEDGGVVKVRAKTAWSQSALNNAPWSSSYTDKYTDIDVPDDRWIRFELTLEEASVPKVNQFGVTFDEVGNPVITGNGRIQPTIGAKAEILVEFVTTINGNARIRPVLTGDGRVSPVIGANAQIWPSIPANGRIQTTEIETISGDGRVIPTLSGDARIQPVIGAKAEISVEFIKTITANGRIQTTEIHTIDGSGRVRPVLTADARIQPVIGAKAEISVEFIKTITANGRIQTTEAETISGDGRVRPVLGGDARIQPVIGAKAEISVEFAQTINGNGRIQTTETKNINGDGRIQPSINARADILVPHSNTINGDGRIQPVIGAKAEISVEFVQTINANGRIQTTETKSISGDGRIQPTISATAMVAEAIPANARIQVTESDTIDGDARIQPVIGAKAEIQVEFTQTINANGRIQTTETQTLTGDGRVSPVIGGNAEILVPTFQTIGAKAEIEVEFDKTITANARIQPILTAKAEIEVEFTKTITANANIVIFDKGWNTEADFDTGTYNNTEYAGGYLVLIGGQTTGTWTVDFDSGFGNANWKDAGWINIGDGGAVKIRFKTAYSQSALDSATWSPYYTEKYSEIDVPDDRWIRLEITLDEASVPQIPYVALSYDEVGNPIIEANGRIRPVITANAEISVTYGQTIVASALIVPKIEADARIQPSIGASASITLPSNIITADATIQLPKSITANARIQPNLTARALVVESATKTINCIARVLRDTTTRIFISSDVKANILLYERYQDLRGLVVDENYYTRDGHVVPRKRGRTVNHTYLFALQSPLHPDTIWAVYLNNSYKYHILTDAVGIAPFRLFVAQGRDRIDVVRKDTDSQVMQINPTTRVNLIPFESNSSMLQEETFVIRNIDGSIIRLSNSEYSFVDAHHVQIASSAYDSSAIYTIYYSVLENQAQEVETKKYSAWINALNYLTWFGAYSEELMLVDANSEETRGNTYIASSTHQGLQDNFGEPYIKTSPDPTWSVEGYRELIEEFYHSYHRSSVTYKGVKDGVGNIVTIPPKIESYRTYKKWVLGWQFLPNRDLIVNTLSGMPDGWLVTGGTCANPTTPVPKYGESQLEVTATGGEAVVIEANAIHTWRRFAHRKWRLRGWLKKSSGPSIPIFLQLSEDGGITWKVSGQLLLTNTDKRFSFEKIITKYATSLRARFVIGRGASLPTAGIKIYLDWPSLEEMRDKSLHLGASVYSPDPTDSVYWSTVPRDKAKSYHGFRIWCWGIDTLTDNEKELVGFLEVNGVDLMNPNTGHPYWIKSAEAILELVTEDDFRLWSGYDMLVTGEKVNMEAVLREDVSTDA
jgi:hypothetical protein